MALHPDGDTVATGQMASKELRAGEVDRKKAGAYV